jgi:hypothetical protein
MSEFSYQSCAGRHCNGTDNVIWAGFGSDGNTAKKKNWVDYGQILRAFFSCFRGQKKFKNMVVSELKSCIIFFDKIIYFFF